MPRQSPRRAALRQTMNLQTDTIEKICSRRNEIAAYIDGELELGEEFALEIHFAKCSACAAELNEQKKLLCALDSVLDGEREIELPVNFTKIVVAYAESKVNGLRQPKERFSALFVCAALFLLVILGLGSETEAVLYTFIKFAEQILAVAAFTAHLFYDFSFGIVVILRSLSYQFVFGSTTSFAFLLALFFISLLTLSGLITWLDRA